MSLLQEKGGMFKGVLGKSTKSGKEEMPGQDNFSMDGDLNGSSDSLSENNNTKEKGGMFGGVFKKSLFTRPQSREDLTSDLSVSSDNLSEETSKSSDFSVSSDSLNNNKKSSKEKPGMLGGILKQTPKAAHRRAESQDHLSLDGDLSNSNDSSSADNTKEKSSKFGGMFKGWTKGPNSQSQVRFCHVALLSPGAYYIMHILCIYSIQMNNNLRHLFPRRSCLCLDSSNSPIANSLRPLLSKAENGPDSDGEEENADPQSGNKQNKLTGAMMMLNPFRSANKYDKHTGSDEEPTGDEKTSSSKQNSVVGAMAKMNPFRSANKKDHGQAETDKEVEKQGEEKSKPVKSSPHPKERMDRSRAPSFPVKPAKKDNKNMALRQKENVSESPSVPARPTEEELSRTSRHVLQKPNNENQNQSDDEVLTEFEEGRSIGEEDVKLSETKAAKMIKPKRHNPFLPPVADKAPSDDEGLKEDEPLNTEEGNAEEEGKGQAVTTKPKKTKKHNPFLPQVKVRRPKRNPQDELTAVDDAAENEGGNRSLFDRLEDFRIDRDESDDQVLLLKDVEGLMEWWSTVERWAEWNETSNFQEEDEELAVEQAADRLFMAARLFVRIFNQRGASLQHRILELLEQADAADHFHKRTVSAAVGGGVASVAGSVATITGLILVPFTFGVSIIVTAVGITVATAGSIASATANITDAVHSNMDRKKVEKMIQGYQDEIKDISECLEFVQEGMSTLQEWDFEKYSQSAAKKALNHNIKHVIKEGGRAGKELVVKTNELISTVQLLGAAGGAAKAAHAISITTGVMSALFLALDVFFLAKDSHELRKGAKTKFAKKIREVCKDLQDGLLELNKVKSQLQKTMDGIELEEVEEILEVEEEVDEEESGEELESDPVKLAQLYEELDVMEEKLDKRVQEEKEQKERAQREEERKEKEQKEKKEKAVKESKGKEDLVPAGEGKEEEKSDNNMSEGKEEEGEKEEAGSGGEQQEKKKSRGGDEEGKKKEEVKDNSKSAQVTKSQRERERKRERAKAENTTRPASQKEPLVPGGKTAKEAENRTTTQREHAHGDPAEKADVTRTPKGRRERGEAMTEDHGKGKSETKEKDGGRSWLGGLQQGGGEEAKSGPESGRRKERSEEKLSVEPKESVAERHGSTHGNTHGSTHSSRHGNTHGNTHGSRHSSPSSSGRSERHRARGPGAEATEGHPQNRGDGSKRRDDDPTASSRKTERGGDRAGARGGDADVRRRESDRIRDEGASSSRTQWHCALDLDAGGGEGGGGGAGRGSQKVKQGSRTKSKSSGENRGGVRGEDGGAEVPRAGSTREPPRQGSRSRANAILSDGLNI
ncbi:unnamed protein product [Lota lota]